MKCNALGPGFCPSRQGRVLTESEEKCAGVPEQEFCRHLINNQCTFNMKGIIKNGN